MPSMNQMFELAAADPFRVPTDVEFIVHKPVHPSDARRWNAPKPERSHMTRTGHIVGATYFSMYEGDEYVVIGEDEHGRVVICTAGYERSTHCTHWRPSERIIAMPEPDLQITTIYTPVSQLVSA